MPPSLADLTDEELTTLADNTPRLDQFDDHQLAALAVHQGLMQEDEAEKAIIEKKRKEREPEAAAVAGALSFVNPSGLSLPAPVIHAMLTRGGKVGDVAAQVLTPIAGSIAGGAAGGPPGAIAGGVAGGVAGEGAAQTREYFRGERDDVSKGRLVTAAITGGVPMGKTILKKPVEVIVKRGLQGVGIAAGAEAVGEVIDHGRVNLKQLALTGVLGGLFGAGAGSIESALTRRAVLKAIRRTPEFDGFEGTDRELVDEVRKRMTPQEPAAPGPRNVTPEGGAPLKELPRLPAKSATDEMGGGIVGPVVDAKTGKPVPLNELSTDALLSLAKKTETDAIIPTEQPAAAPTSQPLPPVKYTVQRADIMNDGTGRRIKPFVQIDALTNEGLGEPLTDAQRAQFPQPPPWLKSGEYTREQIEQAISGRPTPEVMRFPPLADLPPLSHSELSALGRLIVETNERGLALKSGATPEAVPAGPQPARRKRFGPRADGEIDIIDAIQDLGGVPRPGDKAGGEFDGFKETFIGPARILVSKSRGGIDQFIEQLAGAYPQFDHLRTDTNAFYSTVIQALRTRVQVKKAVGEQVKEQRFVDAALQPKARGGRPVNADDLNVGAKVKVSGAVFDVTKVDPETGAVTLKDGPKFGTREVPAGTTIYPDKGGVRNPQPKTDFIPREEAPAPVAMGAAPDELFGADEIPFNLASEVQTAPAAPKSAAPTGEMFAAGEVRSTAPTAMDKANAAARARASATAAGSIGAVGKRPEKEPAGTSGPALTNDTPPPVTPADDPTYSQLPIQLPEMVQLYKMISGGKVAKIVEKVRLLNGTALGAFRWIEGKFDSGEIELRADLFNLLSKREKQELLGKAVAWAKAMKEADEGANLNNLVRDKFNQLVREAEEAALKKDPTRALETFAHEIGHFVDFIPDSTISRGNILGRIASLKRYLKEFIAENPAIAAHPHPSDAIRQKLRRRAEKQLNDEITEIVETIRREVPVYQTIPITAEHIKAMMGQAAREEFPELYDWFSQLDRADKVSILKTAMKGIVDERAKRFGAKKQVGTEVVEETVTRRVGEEVTPEAIRKRYGELLTAELKRRGLISQKDIRAELEATIAWWNGTEKIPDYYKTAEEMYAETFSILLNNPAGLAKRAPTFYKAFFNYLHRKPTVHLAYNEVLASIRSGAIHQQRVTNLREAFQADEESALLKDIAGSKLDWRKIRDTLRLLFDRQQAPIQSRALKHLDSPSAKGVLSALKNYLYRMTAVEGYARALNLTVEQPLASAGLRHDDLAEFMFHRRIADGDRQQLANAQGWSPNTSAERLAEMQRTLTPFQWEKLNEAARANRRVYEHSVVNLLKKADVLTPELMAVIEERTLYATFAKAREFNPLEHGTIEGLLEQSYGKDATAKIYNQLGYLGDIRSPYLAMTQKAFALINFAYKQMAVKSVVRFMEQHEPTLIAEAELRFNGRHFEPRIVETSNVGTLLTLESGKLRAYYVPREIVESLERGSPLESMIVGLATKVLSWPKALLTELNPGFWPVAFAKDVATLGLQLKGGAKAIANIPEAHRAARALAAGRPNKLADQALERLMVISRADPRGEHLGQADEMTRMLLRMGQNPQLWDAEAEKISRAMRFWMAWKQQGQILERTVKIAGMMHLDSEEFASMPEWMKKRTVNELAGSPDFLERGRAASVLELSGGPIFYNAWLRGVQAMKDSAQRNPRGFFGKFMAFFGLPMLALYGFEKGWLDLGMDPEEAEDKRDQLRSIPERDKLRGFVIPMGWQDKEQGKVAYLMLPFPDQARYLTATLRKSVQTAGGDDASKLGVGSLIQFGGQDLPGQNPMIAEANKWWQFAALGRNPYDSFRGMPVIDEDKFKAGSGAGDLAKQSAANLTGGILYKPQFQKAGDTPTGMEEFLKTPVISNLLGRWVRVSNAGLTEEADRITEPAAKKEAGLRVIGEEMIRKTLAGETWTASENTLAQNEPYLIQYVSGSLGKVIENSTGPEMRAFNRATSVEQKAALMQAWADREKAKAERLAPAGGRPAAAP